MKFKEWIVIQEAKGVVNRGGNNIQRRPVRQNDDLPLNRAPVAVASGISRSIMQNLEKSGADHQGTPGLPGYQSDDMEKGEIMDDQGVTYAELPLQIPSIMQNGNPTPSVGLDPKKMRTKNNIDGDPSVDDLYIVFDSSKGHDQGVAERHTAELADAEVMRLLTRSGEINKVDPKPIKKKYLNGNILTVVYQFKKKGGK